MPIGATSMAEKTESFAGAARALDKAMRQLERLINKANRRLTKKVKKVKKGKKRPR
jgi:hypothetical protein